ncbi:MAG: hypothetical protein V1813_01165, partial [Candidatus Aenigmatarchaeota archaeon]
MKRFFLNEDFKNGKRKLHHGSMPYIRKLRQLSKITVWLVDGEYVRKNVCEDFVNYDHHGRLPFIPEDEFWIAQGSDQNEMKFYIDRMYVEHVLIASGMGYDRASEKAAIFEKRERAKFLAKEKLGSLGGNIKLFKMVRKKLLKSYSGRVKVWVVDGTLVRDFFFTDFGGGGHDRIYHFVPENEIWIDDDISEGERKFIILHELHERGLMAAGASYADGHAKATVIEDFFRHHPKR